MRSALRVTAVARDRQFTVRAVSDVSVPPRSRDRRSNADAAEARQLERRMAQVEAGDEAEQIDLDALDPADLDAEQAPQA